MKQNWKQSDVFVVRNSDGMFTPGQIIAREYRTLQSLSCAFFDQRVSSVEESKTLNLDFSKCFSVLLSTPDEIDCGLWPVVGTQTLVVPKKLWPFEDLLSNKKMGARVYGSGIVNDFLNAFYGLQAWDDWHKPDFLDSMLISADKKPKNLILVKT